MHDGNLPALIILRFPTTTPLGRIPGALTPQAYVAQNDHALGRVVDIVSHSRYWASTAIFSIEDDSQNGPDHVDDQRTTFYLASPYAAPGVHHAQYTTSSVMRTIELLLGLPPMTIYDTLAPPMYDAFASAARPAALRRHRAADRRHREERTHRVRSGAERAHGFPRCGRGRSTRTQRHPRARSGTRASSHDPLVLAGTTFAASAVEFVEAATIVMAVGVANGWRPALAGTIAATLALIVLVGDVRRCSPTPLRYAWIEWLPARF